MPAHCYNPSSQESWGRRITSQKSSSTINKTLFRIEGEGKESKALLHLDRELYHGLERDWRQGRIRKGL